jgi:prolyl-tRNA synthetase
MDKELKAAGVENASFPLLVTKEALSMEENHIDGFTPEV